MNRGATILDDRETVEFLRDRPELLAIADAVRATQPQPKAIRRRWRPLLAAAAVLAAALAATALLPAGDSGGPSPAGCSRPTARRPCCRPAAGDPAAGSRPVRLHQERGLERKPHRARRGQGGYYNTLWRFTRQQWIGPDGSGRILQAAGRQYFPTSADRAAWVADGKPNLDDGTGDMNITFKPGGLPYVDLSKAPTDPGALKQLIVERKLESGPPGDGETLQIIGDLLRNSWAPPAVRAALYTIVAQFPGIQLIGATHDQLGRAGTAVGYTSHGNTWELIFDPRTAALLAEEYVDNTGAVTDGWTAYLSSGIVDSTSATVSTTP